MITIQFLLEWALRSSILITGGALLLALLRPKAPSVRLAVWTAMLFGSLTMPVLTASLPVLPFVMTHGPSQQIVVPFTSVTGFVPADGAPLPTRDIVTPKPFSLKSAAVGIYLLVALALLLRLAVGVVISLRLLRGSHPTPEKTGGIRIRESESVMTPVTLGILRPEIVLPGDWREWEAAKLDAVLAHERSHVESLDPLVQFIAAIHRALLWHSPFSWFLHRRIVRVAEEASDDAAITATGDRAGYADVLLSFMQRGKSASVRGYGVPMARYDRPEKRIDRILSTRDVPRRIGRRGVVAILALTSPPAYVAAVAHPQDAPQITQAVVQADPAKPTVIFPGDSGYMKAGQTARTAPKAESVVTASLQNIRVPLPTYSSELRHSETLESGAGILHALGNVAAFYTVKVRAVVDGQLMSTSFNEGDLVQAGQILASIDPRPYQIQLAQAEGQLARDRAQLAEARRIANQRATSFDLIEANIRNDQANIESAKLQLGYTKLASPITGIAGLRLVDPGNIVHATDPAGIVVITQLQPIAVLFTLPEDYLPQVRARVRSGASLSAEAWNRDNTVRLATGRLTAVDNQIDAKTGTARFKAVFDNKDEALFPNQFVNVHLLIDIE